MLRLCDILTVKTVKRIRPIRGSALVHITTTTTTTTTTPTTTSTTTITTTTTTTSNVTLGRKSVSFRCGTRTHDPRYTGPLLYHLS